MRLGAAAVVALALVGCSADYVEEGQATVLLILASINEGAPLASDVRGDNGEITNCPAEVELAVVLKNPNNPGGPVENVILQRYDVTFSRSTDGGVNFSVLANVGANVTAYVDLAVTAGNTYDYRVAAFNTGGPSAYSNTASATIPGPQPPNAPD